MSRSEPASGARRELRRCEAIAQERVHRSGVREAEQMSRVVEDDVALYDVLPTLMDYADLPPEPTSPWLTTLDGYTVVSAA